MERLELYGIQNGQSIKDLLGRIAKWLGNLKDYGVRPRRDGSLLLDKKVFFRRVDVLKRIKKM
jgi:hypothetical protein